jgi:hypothetical protein
MGTKSKIPDCLAIDAGSYLLDILPLSIESDSTRLDSNAAREIAGSNRIPIGAAM